MIPQRLVLKNFLSYREASLDFRGIHTACICGANGAGKSSLLEAISWALWGESRAAEDDIIYVGAIEAQVDFTFICHQRTYRIIRTRQRGQPTCLEFQIAQDSAAATSISPAVTNFRSLTVKGIRATQQLILDHLKLDYETFINSAYLRQGRADEFMLKRSGDRKQILADLLKLDQYDELAERAKDQARQLKGQIDLLERNLATIETQLAQQAQIAQEQADLETAIATMQQQQTADTEQLQALQAIQHQRQTGHQHLTWQQQHQRILTQDCQRLQQEFAAAHHQQQTLEALLQQESAIGAGFAHFQALQAQEEIFANRFQAYQRAQTQRQQDQQQQADRLNSLRTELQKTQAQIESLLQQEAEVQHILQKTADVEAAIAQLQQARTHLHQLDQRQAHVSPLLQRRQHLQAHLDRAATRLLTRLEELQTAAQQLKTQQSRQPHLHQAVSEVSDRIQSLEQRRAYQQRVREKGLERRSFMERLQAHQRSFETQLAEVEQKIQLLKQGVERREAAIVDKPVEIGRVAEASSAYPAALPLFTASLPSYPPCPLCDRPLDEHHWQLVLQKHQDSQQEILEQIWVIRDQLAVSEREIQVLRQEYKELDQELAQYGSALERRGQLQEQLQATANLQASLQQILTEVAAVEQTLQMGDYAADLQEELSLLDRSLAQLNYDEKDHALARGDVDRWRWAEIKHAEIKQAQKKQVQIAQRLPDLQQQLTHLEQQFEQVNAETDDRLNAFDRQIAEIGYDLDRHNHLRTTLRQAQSWQLRYQELQHAHQTYPPLCQRTTELAQALQERQQHLQIAQAQVQALVQQLEQFGDRQPQIQQLEQRIQQRRQHLDTQLSHLGRLQQQQQQAEALKTQNSELKTQLQSAQRQLRVYQELAQAFGKNGIQTLMIENVLPQLEAEANQILNRLSGNQLHVQFVTQRSHRNASSKAQTTKLIETLDILIADSRGTRPYETYSGGEAFRVNFAIRLALSRLLAQRSGTALQMLIIDEGFGTQDAEGCDRLIAAINAIATDFACILTVTHVPHFKEAFQSRIEVYKTETGSHLSLSL